MNQGRITGEVVRTDFNAPQAVLHYTRAAHFLGLWESERILMERFFPDRSLHLLEAGCGAGRATLGLWHLGFTRITAFDFAGELLEQARALARALGAGQIEFVEADACDLSRSLALAGGNFDGVVFTFNGLMQIPGRSNRERALRGLRSACRPGATILFTTHDREATGPEEHQAWAAEAVRWSRGEQDRRLAEFGDRYFSDPSGSTFMHLPDRAEVLGSLAAAGWEHAFDALRREVAAESQAVRDFSDECRFWAAVNPGTCQSAPDA